MVNPPQRIPDAFLRIVINDEERDYLRSLDVVPFVRWQALVDERRRLRAAAQAILRRPDNRRTTA